MLTCIQVMLTGFEYVPLIEAVGIKFQIYDETLRENLMPTFIQTVLRKRALINPIKVRPLIKALGIKFSLYDKQVYLLCLTKLTQRNFMQNVSA